MEFLLPEGKRGSFWIKSKHKEYNGSFIVKTTWIDSIFYPLFSRFAALDQIWTESIAKADGAFVENDFFHVHN